MVLCVLSILLTVRLQLVWGKRFDTNDCLKRTVALFAPSEERIGDCARQWFVESVDVFISA